MTTTVSATTIQVDNIADAAGTGSPTFAYGFAGTSKANIRSSEGAGTTTLTTADNPFQVFNLTASRNVVLPSTGVPAGYTVVLENTTNFDLIVQAATGPTTIQVNKTTNNAAAGSSGEPRIAIGRVVLVAVSATPAATTDWRIAEVYERSSYTDTTTGAIATTATIEFYRHNKMVVISAISGIAAPSATDNITVPATNNPLRIRPTASYPTVACVIRTAGTKALGFCEAIDSGALVFQKSDQTVFTTSAGIGNGSPTEFCYVLLV